MAECWESATTNEIASPQYRRNRKSAVGTEFQAFMFLGFARCTVGWLRAKAGWNLKSVSDVLFRSLIDLQSSTKFRVVIKLL